MNRVEIGYLCGKGHYVFYADPERDGYCDSNRTAGIYVELDEGIEFFEPYEVSDDDGFVFMTHCGYSEKDYKEELAEADAGLARMIGIYRKS